MTPTSELNLPDETPAAQGVTCERHLSGSKAIYAALGTALFLVLLVAAGYWYLHTH